MHVQKTPQKMETMQYQKPGRKKKMNLCLTEVPKQQHFTSLWGTKHPPDSWALKWTNM